MADIVLRRLDDGLKEKLRQRAAVHRRSMNEELLQIVAAALSGPRGARAGADGRAELKRLAADIRSLSAGRTQTPSQDLLRDSRKRR